MKTEKDWESRCVKIAKDQLLGKKIVKVEYMSDQDMKEFGWYCRPIILQLDDGNFIFPSADDEGNNGGAIFTTNKKIPVLPVMR